MDPRGPAPAFDARFAAPTPPMYFHHVVDADAGTLTVQVLGPNLTYTFHHDRAGPPSRLTAALARKTVGFLALRLAARLAARPFDAMGVPTGAAAPGVFLSAHVEVKLAAHAVAVARRRRPSTWCSRTAAARRAAPLCARWSAGRAWRCAR